ncbi:MAG: phosphatidate cytidylyltransferase [Polyangiales bacterium]
MDVSRLALSQPLPRLLVEVYGFIATCSVFTLVHPTLRRPDKRSVRQAVNSWWPPALLSGAAVLLGAVVAVPLFAVVSAWTLTELLRVLPATDRPRGTTTLAYAAVPVHYVAILSGDPDLAGGASLFAWLFLAMPLARALRHGPDGVVAGAARVGLAAVLTVFALGFVARLFLLPAHIGPAGAPGFAAVLLLSVMANDASQYLFGKLFGRTPLVPVISPRKTWEGFAGGVAVTAGVTAAAAPAITGLGRVEAAVVGALLASLGLLGDLLISALKRDVGVKDTGAVLPGQGGVLDRMDSLLLAAPAFYFYAQARGR